jgi:N-terminal half of MaoC dehydratase
MTTDQDSLARQGDIPITEEALERVYAQVGVVKDAFPWATHLTFDLSRHFALYCLASDNPLWTDSSYASANSPTGQPLVAPMAEYVAASADTRMGGVGLPGLSALHASDDWQFHRRLALDERVHATIGLADVSVKESKWSGQAVWQTREFKFYDADGGLVSEYRPVSVRVARRSARERAAEQTVEPYRYTDAEIDAIAADYDAETTRGAEVRFLEDVTVGATLGHVVKGPLTVMDLMCWWIGAGGPYIQAFRLRHLVQKRYPSLGIRDRDTNVPRSPEDAHVDLDYARRTGVALPFDIGRQRTASLVHLATNWAGDAGYVSQLRTRLTGRNYIGDTSWYRGEVAGVDPQRSEAICDVWGENQRGVRHTTGELRIRLPSRLDTGSPGGSR